jgi:hypothetical protein
VTASLNRLQFSKFSSIPTTDDSFKFGYSSFKANNSYEFPIVSNAKIVAVAG